MISVTDLRSGTVFEDQGQVFVVISYEHIKMGRGSANIKVRVRNIKTGTTLEKSFINGAKVKDLAIRKIELQFLYKDEESAHFMDSRTFEQIPISLSKVPEHPYLKEGESYSVSILSEEPLSVSIPPKINLKVVETTPDIKGNSATNVYKDATLENGIKTKVPLFIKLNDMIRVDTRTGEYSEKV